MVRVLFVCLGNICRSPIAEGVFRTHVEAAGLGARFAIGSAGTGDWHVGDPPDPRMCAAGKRRGFEIGHQRARTVRRGDLARWDHVLVMDRANETAVRRLAGAEELHRIALFRSFDPEPGDGEVPDPYYGGPEGFDRVIDIVERTSAALLAHLRQVHRL